MRIARLKLAEVRWLDAHVVGSGAWTEADEVERTSSGPAVCMSVGYVVHANETVVALAPTFSQSMGDPEHVGEFGPTISIPRGMVKSVRYLK